MYTALLETMCKATLVRNKKDEKPKISEYRENLSVTLTFPFSFTLLVFVFYPVFRTMWEF